MENGRAGGARGPRWPRRREKPATPTSQAQHQLHCNFCSQSKTNHVRAGELVIIFAWHDGQQSKIIRIRHLIHLMNHNRAVCTIDVGTVNLYVITVRWVFVRDLGGTAWLITVTEWPDNYNVRDIRSPITPETGSEPWKNKMQKWPEHVRWNLGPYTRLQSRNNLEFLRRPFIFDRDVKGSTDRSCVRSHLSHLISRY